MKCYKCARIGKEADAVCIWVVCGMGLCMEHARMTNVSFREAHLLEQSSVTGLGMVDRTETRVPKILCDECYARVAEYHAGPGKAHPSGVIE